MHKPLLSLLLLLLPLLAAAQTKTLDIYWVDVEGGAATLIVTPAGESILIDTGNPGGRDAGRIHKAATDAGLKQIDYLVTTHFHIDHYGGAAELARKMPVLNIYDKGVPEALPEDAQFAERIQEYNDIEAKRQKVSRGTQLKLKKARGAQPLTFRFVGADQQFDDAPGNAARTDSCDAVADKAVDNSDNANSTVMLLEYGPFRFFDGGDLTWNVEKTLVCPVNRLGTVDVFQVNHHGLDQSNHPLLVKALQPTVAVMGNGTRKGCGPATFTTLKSTPSVRAIYQAHKNLREDSQYNAGDAYIANLEAECQGNYVKLSVAPDGKSYTVSIPASGHTQTYQTRGK
ncbi:MAG TPA: MBL fold metallo-hydrolase [Cytophagales bacterium]|jgi:beta-lactamase superfamily II metal-dependent hydrolase